MQIPHLSSSLCKGLLFFSLLTLASPWPVPVATGTDLPTTPKAETAMAQTRPKIQQELQAKGFAEIGRASCRERV